MPHQLWLLPQQLRGLPHQFSMDLEVFRFQTDHHNPKVCHDVRFKGFMTLKDRFSSRSLKNHQPISLFAPPTLPKKLHPCRFIVFVCAERRYFASASESLGQSSKKLLLFTRSLTSSTTSRPCFYCIRKDHIKLIKGYPRTVEF